MPVPNKKAGQAKFTAWAETTRMEGAGTIEHCTRSLFTMLTDEKRTQLLSVLQASHNSLVAKGF